MHERVFSYTPPTAPLVPHLRSIMIADFPEPQRVEVTVPPLGDIYIGWVFAGRAEGWVGGALQIEVSRPTVHYAGQVPDHEVKVVYDGLYGHVIAVCRATGFYALTGIPGIETVGRTVALSGLGMPRLSALCGLEAMAFPGEDRITPRLRAFRRALEYLARDPLPVPDAVRIGAERLEASFGTLPIGELVEGLGVSPQHFARRFKHFVGLSPKTYARCLMLNKAVSLMLSSGAGSQARIAAEAGFWDQAHMIASARKMLRATPRHLLERDNSLLPEFYLPEE